jgi:hypothetical protein
MNHPFGARRCERDRIVYLTTRGEGWRLKVEAGGWRLEAGGWRLEAGA